MKKTIIRLFALIILFNASPVAAGDKVSKETYLYAVKGTDSLWLDKYDMIKDGQCAKTDKHGKPAVIFMFGGGFTTGERDKKNYIPYFNFLAENGYAVLSIDYRLGLKDIGRKKDITPAQFIMLFASAVEIAVEDLFDATAFAVENARQWDINPKKIIANGSSAGAVAVLQGEYEICNKTLLTEKLPRKFNYAGVVSFAGAILAVGELSFAVNPCPIMVFHGDADSNVPYDKLEEMGAGLYGSKYIAGYLESKNLPYWFWSVENAAHEIAGTPMDENREEIMSFMNKLLEQGKPFMIDTNVRQIGKKTPNKQFTIMDYVKSNFGQ